MSETRFFEDVEVGDCWTSAGRTITESDVVSFACLTGDFDPLHTDHEYARSTPFGQPIAHGLLGLSYLAGLSSQQPAMRNLAFISIREWQFCKPICVGDTLHVQTEVIGKQARGRRSGSIRWHRRLLNQRGELVQHGVLETLVATRLTAGKGNEESKSTAQTGRNVA